MNLDGFKKLFILMSLQLSIYQMILLPVVSIVSFCNKISVQLYFHLIILYICFNLSIDSRDNIRSNRNINTWT